MAWLTSLLLRIELHSSCCLTAPTIQQVDVVFKIKCSVQNEKDFNFKGFKKQMKFTLSNIFSVHLSSCYLCLHTKDFSNQQ